MIVGAMRRPPSKAMLHKARHFREQRAHSQKKQKRNVTVYLGTGVTTLIYIMFKFTIFFNYSTYMQIIYNILFTHLNNRLTIVSFTILLQCNKYLNVCYRYNIVDF